MTLRWIAMAALSVAVTVTGAGCGGRSGRATPPAPSRGSVMTVSAELKAAMAVLREAGPEAGVGPASSVRSYPPERMYEAIDGEADLFLAYGCKGLVVGRYKAGTGAVDAELFDQADALNAYGVFSQLRGQETPVAVGAEGVNVAGEAVLFWKSRYFVRVSTSDVKQLPDGALERVARSTADGIEGSSKLPAWTEALPEGHDMEGRTQYVARNVLGHGFLSNAMIGEYGEGTSACQLALAQAAGEEEARAQWRRLEEFYHGRAEAGGGGRPAPDAFVGEDRMGRPVRGVRSGRYVVVMVGGTAPEMQRLINTTLGNLARIPESAARGE